MQLPGRLALTTLGDVLGILYRGEATGVLELTEPGGERCHRVLLREGRVLVVESPLGPTLLGLLVRVGLAPRRADECKRATSSELEQLRWLSESRDVSDTALESAQSLLVSARLDALGSLADAKLRFRVPRTREERAAFLSGLSAREFLHGRARRRDRHEVSVGESRSGDGESSSEDTAASSTRREALRTLGLRDGATPEDVRRAFRTLAKSAHPDRLSCRDGDESVAALRRFAEISAAYHALSA